MEAYVEPINIPQPKAPGVPWTRFDSVGCFFFGSIWGGSMVRGGIKEGFANLPIDRLTIDLDKVRHYKEIRLSGFLGDHDEQMIGYREVGTPFFDPLSLRPDITYEWDLKSGKLEIIKPAPPPEPEPPTEPLPEPIPTPPIKVTQPPLLLGAGIALGLLFVASIMGKEE